MSNFSRYLLCAALLAIFSGCAVPGASSDAGVERDVTTHNLGSYPFAYPVGPASGDLANAYPNPTVAKINGVSVAAGGEAGVGNLLTFAGDASATWQPPALGAQPTGTGVWHEVDGGLQAAALKGTAGQFLTENGTATDVSFASCSGDVSCATGTPGQVTVLDIHGSSVPAGGSLTTGNTLGVTGSSALGYSALNLGGGAGYVSGALPVGNLAPGTAAQVLVTNSGATAPAWVSLSQDVTTTAAGVCTVNSIHGSTPVAITPNELQWVKGATPLLDTAVQTTDVAPPTTTISGAGSEPTAATHISGGNLVLNGGLNSQQVAGAGTVGATNGLPTITGAGTAFGNQLTYGNQPIVIAGVSYNVLTVQSATALTLTSNYTGTTASGLSYTFPAGVPGSIILNTPASGNGGNESFVVQTFGTGNVLATMGQDPGLSAGFMSWALWGPGIVPAGNNLAFGTNTTDTVVEHSALIELIAGAVNALSCTNANVTFSVPLVEWNQITATPTIQQLGRSSDLATNAMLVRAQATVGNGFTAGAGTVGVTNGSPNVTGSSTTFTTANYVGQNINIAANVYVIQSITDATHLVLESNVSTATTSGLSWTQSNVPYLGAGTVGATNGTTAVVGVGTTFTTTAFVGQTIQIQDSTTHLHVQYTINTITDATHLALLTNYSGTTATGLSYTESAFNVNGAPLILEGGQPSQVGVLGLGGPVRLCTRGSTANCGIEWAEPVVGQRVVALNQIGSGITSTQLPTNSGDGIVWLGNTNVQPTAGVFPVGGALLSTSAGSITVTSPKGVVTDLNGAGTGTVNSQDQTFKAISGTLRISNSTPTTIFTVPTSSAQSLDIEAKIVCRATTAETGGAIGDTASFHIEGTYRNVGGTVTAIGTTTNISTKTDTSDASMTGVFTISGTNINVQVSGPTGASAGVHDCQVTGFYYAD